MGWRNSLFSVFNDYNNFSIEELFEMDSYQFGVLEGQSMCELSYLFVKNRIKLNSFNGFDTFTGMPKETAEPVFQDSWDPDIDPDTFNTVKRLGVDSVETCVNLIKEKVEKTFINSNFKTDIKLFSGLVENTLKENFQKSNFKKAFYVDFDMDIYSPTKYAFNFLMENDLIIPGTIIGYDDWGGTPDYDKFRYGESRAHKEIVDQWGLKVTKLFEIGDSFPHVQNAWIVEDVK